MSSSSQGGGPSPDAIASIITQVPQSGPTSTARPARPIKAREAQKKRRKAAATGKAAASTGPAVTAADPGIAQHESEQEKAAHARDAGIAAAAEQAGTSASVSPEADGQGAAGPTGEAGAVGTQEDSKPGTAESEGKTGDATLVEPEASASSLPKDGAPGASLAVAPAGTTGAKDDASPPPPTAQSNQTPRYPSSSTTTTGKPTKPNTPSAPRSPDKKKKSRRRLLRILLPCLSPSGHAVDEDNRRIPAKQKADGQSTTMEMKERPSKSTTGGSAGQQPKRTGSGKGGPSITPSPNPSIGAAAAGKPSRSPSNGRKSRGATPSGGGDVAPTPVKDTTTAAGAAAAAAAANAGAGGVELPIDETAGVLSGAVVPPGKEGSTPRKKVAGGAAAGEESELESGSELAARDAEDEDASAEEGSEGEEGEEEADEEEDEEDRIIAMGGMGIPVDENGVPRPLLGELESDMTGRKCLVLDLDETLVHSSFKMIHQADFIVPVEIENSVHNVYVIKRPGVDQFMKRMGEIYEVVVFTASLSKYADPVLDMLDIHRVVKHRLFRESCYNHRGNYVKDLSQLGRPIGETIIIDNSPASYIFHPNNAVPVSSWFNDPHDTELTDLVSFLADVAQVPDVRAVLDPRLA